MSPKGVYNTLYTAFGGTKRDWEREKEAKREQERRDFERERQDYLDSHPEENVNNTAEQDGQKDDVGPSMGDAHDPNDAYAATQNNVKKAIMSVSQQPGAMIAQKELHKQAAQQFAKSKGINVAHFMELHPDAQKRVMASPDPMALLERYNNHPNYWVQQ